MIVLLCLPNSRQEAERLVEFVSNELPNEEFKIITVRDMRNIFTKLNFLDSLNGNITVWTILNSFEMTRKEIGEFLNKLDMIALNIKIEIYCLIYEDPKMFDRRALEFLNKYGWI
jgi:DNA polymerase III delta prime subunit